MDNKIDRKIDRKIKREDIGKAYGEYAKAFTPRPSYSKNAFKAFLFGGLICAASQWLLGYYMELGLSKNDSNTLVNITLIMIAQLLTGIGVFDIIAKYCGAGVIVPITGFANSMVATAIEYKREGPVLGVGAKLFSVAGPVLVVGIFISTIIGIVNYFMR